MKNQNPQPKRRSKPLAGEALPATTALQAAKESPFYDPLFDAKGAAAYANCSLETIRRAVRARELGSVRASGVSSHIRVRLSALNAWLKKMEQPARKNA